MWNIFKKITLPIGALLFLSLPGFLHAGDDPSIKGNLRENIQTSMNDYINEQTINGRMYLYDALQGDLLKMELVELHDGIVKKGDFYVSCADFTDQDDRVIDVDFLVRRHQNSLITTQAIVHSVDGTKRKYHLEKM